MNTQVCACARFERRRVGVTIFSSPGNSIVFGAAERVVCSGVASGAHTCCHAYLRLHRGTYHRKILTGP